MPVLSIIVPNFNYAKYLPECLNSILNQSFSDFEIIIIDDASTDESCEVISSFSINESRIRFLRNKVNLGVVKTANHGAALASGKYITFLASDDKFLPGHFEASLELLENHPNVGLCTAHYGNFTIQNPDPLEGKLQRKIQHSAVFNAEEAIRFFRKTYFWIPGSATIMKRSLFMENGLCEQMGPFCDWFLHHAIALKYGFAYIPKMFSAMRLHENTYTLQTNANRTKRLQYLFYMLDFLKRDRELKKKFQKSTVLRFYLDAELKEVLLRPSYWEYALPVFEKKLLRRLRLARK